MYCAKQHIYTFNRAILELLSHIMSCIAVSLKMLWQSTVSGVLLLKEGASKTQAMHLGRFVQISSRYKLSLWILYVAPSAADCMNVISVVHFFPCLAYSLQYTHTHTQLNEERRRSVTIKVPCGVVFSQNHLLCSRQ